MSSKKRTTLDAIFTPPKTDATPPAPTPAPSKARTPAVRRTGKKQPTAYLDEPVYEQLRKLGFEERRKMHSYLMEGLDRVFADRGMPSIKSLVPSYPYALTPGGGYALITAGED
jgi:hypothetical protein